MTRKIVLEQLSKKIDKKLVEELLKYYEGVKRSYHLKEWEKASTQGGKFCEATIKVLHFIKFGNIITEVEFDKRFYELIKLPKNNPEDEVITLILPRILRSIYTLRSKRGATHIKGIDPNYIDSTYITSGCDWVVAELLRLYHTSEPNEIRKIIEVLVSKKLPIIWEIDGFLKVLNPEMSLRDGSLAILYHRGSSWTTDYQLLKWCESTNMQYLKENILKVLQREKLIHRDDDRSIITPRGILYIEKNIDLEISL